MADVSILQRLLIGALGQSVLPSLTVWIAYLALEPFVRRRWPWRLVEWNRLLEGKWRDPSLGRGILIGGLAGVISACVIQLQLLTPMWLGQIPESPWVIYEGAFRPFLRLFQNPAASVQVALVWLFFLFLACFLGGREWLAVAMILVLAVVTNLLGPQGQVCGFAILGNVIVVSIHILVGLRFGSWSLVVASFFFGTLVHSVIGLDWSTWYATSAAVATLTLVAVSLFGFWTSVAGQSLFGDE